jgi:hypothetical protein
MRILFWFLFYSFSIASAAAHVASISSIDFGKIPGEESLLYLNDGSVIKLPKKESKNILQFKNLQKEGTLIRWKTSSKRMLISFKILSQRSPVQTKSRGDEVYEPTIVESLQIAEAIFNDLRDNPNSWSQCYNRAHVWVYESKNRHNLNSMKAFLFFTRKYIRQFNYGWWFHVAPLVLVKNESKIEEKILDNSFTLKPTSPKTWTDMFIKSRANCPNISRYSDYENNQETEYCYLYKTSMYYLQPLDLESLERTGAVRKSFFQYEINRAYRNAFR